MSDLTPEERALLAEAENEGLAPAKRGRKPRAVLTDVEPAEENSDLRVIPAQHHGDPWGDTPAQSRF